MFTWICPQCGGEVPPHLSECPNCAAKSQAQAQPAGQPPPPSPHPPVPTPAVAPPPVPPPATPVQAAPPGVQYVYVRRGPPGWVVTLGVAVVLLAVGGGAYQFMSHGRETKSEPKASIGFEAPPPPQANRSSPSSSSSKGVSKYLEVTGIRLVEEQRKPRANITLVNHSGVEIAGVSGEVTLRSTSDGRVIGSFPLQVATIGAYEARELSAPLKTSLRAYEMPDWQYIRADVALREK